MHRDIAAGTTRETGPTTRNFETLDGLRGVAALAVVVWHIPGQTVFSSAYLAVDFFFMLSGFILAYSYDHRLATRREASRFMVMRLIRLYPLYLFGSLPGILNETASIARSGAIDPESLGQIVAALLMLPWVAPGALVFSFNVPAWSLFYELIVNLFYGFTRRRMPPDAVAAMVVLSGIIIIAAAWHFRHMRFTGQMPLFLLGGVRTIFGFFLGVAIYRAWRAGHIPEVHAHPALIALLLLAAMIVPADLGISPALLVLTSFVAFPVILVLGIENQPSGVMGRVMHWAGLLSFPIYAVHYPVVVVMERLDDRFDLPDLLTGAAIVVLSIATAWFAYNLFDQPARRWLTARAFGQRAPASPASR